MGEDLQVMRFKPENTVGCPPHGISAHNFHLDRYGFCLYCNCGSEPVHKSLIEVEE